MIKRTHLMIGLTAALAFLPYVHHRLIFFPVMLLCSLLPDIDSAYSYVGHYSIFRPLQFFVKHRGIVHSFSVCILASLILAFAIPVLALPFFLGYSLHLFADSFTIEGITPFWPWKKISNGLLTTGGGTENIVFYVFIGLSVIFFVKLFL